MLDTSLQGVFVFSLTLVELTIDGGDSHVWRSMQIVTGASLVAVQTAVRT
jgi:hypothetical protein